MDFSVLIGEREINSFHNSILHPPLEKELIMIKFLHMDFNDFEDDESSSNVELPPSIDQATRVEYFKIRQAFLRGEITASEVRQLTGCSFTDHGLWGIAMALARNSQKEKR